MTKDLNNYKKSMIDLLNNTKIISKEDLQISNADFDLLMEKMEKMNNEIKKDVKEEKKS